MYIEQIAEKLEQKLLTLTTAQLIRFMVVGLRTQHTVIDMASFGGVHNEVCYGCAATNAILEILGIPADIYIQETQEEKANPAPETRNTLVTLELFFNALRRGERHLAEANSLLVILSVTLGKEGYFEPIKYPKGLTLPYLSNDYTEKDLQAYEKLANFQ